MSVKSEFAWQELELRPNSNKSKTFFCSKFNLTELRRFIFSVAFTGWIEYGGGTF